MKLQKGFTLVELMIVVAVVAILAAVSIPAYSDYVRRGKITEATTALSSLRVRMEQYYQDNRTYFNGGVCSPWVPLASAPVVKYFNIACVQGVTVDSYLITATGNGSMNGFSYTIDQSNTKITVAVPTGWSLPTPNSCWVTKPGGIC